MHGVFHEEQDNPIFKLRNNKSLLIRLKEHWSKLIEFPLPGAIFMIAFHCNANEKLMTISLYNDGNQNFQEMQEGNLYIMCHWFVRKPYLKLVWRLVVMVGELRDRIHDMFFSRLYILFLRRKLLLPIRSHSDLKQSNSNRSLTPWKMIYINSYLGFVWTPRNYSGKGSSGTKWTRKHIYVGLWSKHWMGKVDAKANI